MALNVYMRLRIDGQDIDGDVQEGGREDMIRVHAVSHSGAAADSTDSTISRLSTVRVQHEPLTIVKAVDRSSPLLWQALNRRSTVDSAELFFYQPSPSGEEENFYTVTLNGGTILAVELEMLNNRWPENMQIPHLERVTFGYGEMTIVHEDTGIMTNFRTGSRE